MASRGYLNAFVNRIVCFQTEKSMWPGQGGRRQTTIYLEEVKALTNAKQSMSEQIEKLQERVTSLTQINEKNSGIIENIKAKISL